MTGNEKASQKRGFTIYIIFKNGKKSSVNMYIVPIYDFISSSRPLIMSKTSCMMTFVCLPFRSSAVMGL